MSTPSGLVVHHMQVSQSERLVWLCEELDIPYELRLHRRDPLLAPQSIRDLNPLGQAPVIQDRGGAVTLAESGACVEYIVHRHGGGRLTVAPADPAYADYLYWLHFSNATLQPATVRLMSMKWAKADEKTQFYRRAVDAPGRYCALMDARLADNTYFAGDQLTIADIMIVFTLTTMRAFCPIDLSPYPNILRYLRTVSERDAFKRARAKGDPDMELMIDGPPPRQFVDRLKEAGKL